jgi:hypothetical protein
VEIDQGVIELQRNRYAERYGITLAEGDTVADMLMKMIDRQTMRFAQRLDSYYRIGFFIAAFILFQLLALPFTWVIIAMTAGVLWFFRTSGSVVLVTRTEPRTSLRWHKPQPTAPLTAREPSSTPSSSGQPQTIE